MTGADWVQVVIGLATLIGLVFVFLELRARNREMRIDAHRYVVEADQRLWAVLLEHPEVAPKLMAERWDGYEGLDSSEALFAAQLLDHMEHVYLRRTRGLIPDELWPAIDSMIRANLSTPTVRSVWTVNRRFYWSEFNNRYGSQAEI